MKNKEENLYKHLKKKLLETNYFSSSLINKAFSLKGQDENYTEKIKTAEPYLLEKISQGDLIAYALYYVENEAELKQIEEHVHKNIEDYLNFVEEISRTSGQSYDSFLDCKIKYISQFLGDSVEC